MRRKKEEIKKIQEELFRIPPDLEKARKHGQAQQARYYESNVNVSKNCWFWWKRVLPDYSRKIELWEGNNKLLKFGDGYPLLFQFLKYVVALFVGIFILQGTFYLIVVLTYYGNGETRKVSITNLVSANAIVKYDGSYDKALLASYEVIGLLTNILLMIITSIFYVKQK